MHHASAVLASYMRIVHHKLGPVIRLNFMIDRHFICLGDTHHEDEFHKKKLLRNNDEDGHTGILLAIESLISVLIRMYEN